MADVLATISIGAVLLVMSLLLTFYGVYHLHYKRYGAFVMTGERKLKANVLATRFCKIVVKNIIVEQCLEDSKKVMLWHIVKNTLAASDCRDLKSIEEWNKLVIDRLDLKANNITTDDVTSMLYQVSYGVDDTLTKSTITTPPYIHRTTYLTWITKALEHVI